LPLANILAYFTPTISDKKVFSSKEKKKNQQKFLKKKNQAIDPISSTLSVQGHAPFYS
jgi:hypothetical protein